MNCPNCKNELKSLTLENKYDSKPILVMQCDNCGGIWFDANGMYLSDESELENLQPLKTEAYLKESVINPNLACPKDYHPLKKFTNGSIIDHLNFFICPFCQGIWTNINDLKTFEQKKLESNITDEKVQSDTAANAAIDMLNMPLGEMTFGGGTIINRAIRDYKNNPDNNLFKIDQRFLNVIRQMPEENRPAVLDSVVTEKKEKNEDNIKALHTINNIFMFTVSLLRMV